MLPRHLADGLGVYCVGIAIKDTVLVNIPYNYTVEIDRGLGLSDYLVLS